MIEASKLHILTAKETNCLKHYNAITGELIHTFKHNEDIQTRFLSKDKKILATISANEFNIWSAINGENLYSLKENIVDIDFSNDHIHCAMAFGDFSIRLFDYVDKKFVLEFDRSSGHLSQINFVRVSFNGKILATGSADGIVKLWNITDGCLLYTLQNTTAVRTIFFSKDMTMISVSCTSGVFKTWKIQLCPLTQIILDIQPYDVLNTSFHTYRYEETSDNIYVAIKNIDKIDIVDPKSNNILMSINTTSNKILFSSDCLFVVVQKNLFMNLYCINTGEVLYTCHYYTFINFSPSGKYFVTVDEKIINIFNLHTREQHLHESSSYIQSLGFTLEDDWLIYSMENDKVIVYNMDKRVIIQNLTINLLYSDSINIYNENARRLLEIIE